MTEEFTWQDFDTAVDLLAERISSTGLVLKDIYGIPRGGLVVAVALSHLLDLPLVMSEESVNASTLVVDDICDSGKTLSPFVAECVTGVIHVVLDAVVHPNFFVRVRESDWVIYPWEKRRESDGQTES